MEELRLYYHPHSKTDINIRSPACAEETLIAGQGPQNRLCTKPNTDINKPAQSACVFVVRERECGA